LKIGEEPELLPIVTRKIVTFSHQKPLFAVMRALSIDLGKRSAISNSLFQRIALNRLVTTTTVGARV
jgi:hypothetical protein